MLTLKLLRESPDFVIRRLAVKNFDATDIVNKIIVLDDHRKALQTRSDALLADQKKAAAAIGQLMKEGKKEEAEEAKREVAKLKARSSELLEMADDNNAKLNELLALLPNIPCAQVPEGLPPGRPSSPPRCPRHPFLPAPGRRGCWEAGPAAR